MRIGVHVHEEREACAVRASVASALVRSAAKTNPPRFLPAPRTACTLRVPWRTRAASRSSCRSNTASTCGSLAANAGRTRSSGSGGYCRQGLGDGVCGRTRGGGGGAYGDGSPRGGPYRSSISSSSDLTGGTGGGGERGLDVVTRWSNSREGALLGPWARLSERARRSSVGGSVPVDIACLAPPRGEGLGNEEGA